MIWPFKKKEIKPAIKIDQSICLAEPCGFICLEVCPIKYTLLFNGTAMDPGKTCTGCGKCIEVCPAKAISKVEDLK